MLLSSISFKYLDSYHIQFLTLTEIKINAWRNEVNKVYGLTSVNVNK